MNTLSNAQKKIKSLPGFSLFLLCFFFTTLGKARADIVFSAKILGPVTNIFSIDKQNQVTKLTQHDNWRDIAPVKNSRNELLFLSNRKANKQVDIHQHSDTFNVFLKDLSSQQVTQLTDNHYRKQQPLFSPNEKWISYLEKQGQRDTLRLINRKTGKTESLVNEDNILDYTWARDSHSIVFTGIKNQVSHITRVNLSDKHHEPLLRMGGNTLNAAQALTPAPALDMTSHGEAATPADNTKLTTAASSDHTNNSDNTIVSLNLSPNGKRLAFISANGGNQQRQLHSLNLRTGKVTTLSAPGVQVQAPVDWSNDSQRVLFAGLENYDYYWDEKLYRKVYQGEMNIFLAHIKGDTQKITHSKALANRPVFSPDEQHIAFLYGESLADQELQLKIMDIANKKTIEKYSPVPGFSRIYWYN